jgi:hypothetical protein
MCTILKNKISITMCDVCKGGGVGAGLQRNDVRLPLNSIPITVFKNNTVYLRTAPIY